MEWLRCEDSSNLFKTPKSVQCCQTGKLKSLINLYYLRNFEIIYRVSVISRRPSLPSLPTAGQGKGGGKEELYQLLNSVFWCIYTNLRGSLTVFDCIRMQRCSCHPISTMDSILSQWHIFNFGDDVRFEHSYAFSVSQNPLYRKCSANARLYILVALCQCTPLYPSGTVPKYTSIP